MIRKAGALIFEDSKLLIVRPHNKPFFINPGGKYEPNESAEECLKRELEEELKVKIISYKYYKTYEIDKAAHANDSLSLGLYLVVIKGDLIACSEINEVIWMTKEDYYQKNYNLAPSFDKFIPDLIKEGYL